MGWAASGARGLLATVALAAALGLAACSGGADDTTEAGPEPAPGDAVGAPAEDSAAREDQPGAGGEGELPTSADRELIRTARLTLESADPEQTVRQARDLAQRIGGFVSGTDLQRGGEGLLSGTMTLRVPSEDLDRALDALAGLDTVVAVPSQQLETEDVTGQVADIQARLRNLRAIEEQLRGLLAEVRRETSSADQLLQVFSRIREIRGEIERLESRQSALDEQVSLATVNVEIQPAPEARAPGDVSQRWAPRAVVRDAWDATLTALQAIANAAIWVGVTGLPLLVVVAIPLLVVGWAVRRRWRARSPGSDDAAGRGPRSARDSQ